jgi:hypothetical protein
MLQYLRHTNHFTSMFLFKKKKNWFIFFLDSGATTAYFLNSYRKPKRHRTAFTPTQLLKLENAFEKNHYIVGQERRELARHLNLPEARVRKLIRYKINLNISSFRLKYGIKIVVLNINV